jgi:hypothetical protein
VRSWPPTSRPHFHSLVPLVAEVSHLAASSVSHTQAGLLYAYVAWLQKTAVGRFAMAVPPPPGIHHWWQIAAFTCHAPAAGHAVLPVPVEIQEPLCF